MLVGRDAEMRMIESLLRQRRGGALVLRGDPGVGKSTLLDAAIELAGHIGRQVLRVAGVEYEAELAFSGLHQALHPISERFEQLPPLQRQALGQAFSELEGPPPNRLAISVAALAALEEGARRQPLLIAIDDLQWIDSSSTEVLLFVARRLADLPIIVLATTRRSNDGLGLPQLEVQPLADEPAAQLLRNQAPALAPAAMTRILGEAAGNPLALVELPGALSERQLAGHESLPESLPLTARVDELFAGRIRSLPEATQFVLLVAVVGGDSLAVVLAATGHSDLDVLSPAVTANLVQVDESRLVFRHPLVRSSVFQMASPHHRRLAHSALAAALADMPERRAWHLAAAALGPDEQVAAAVEEAARTAIRRGGAAVALASFTRAAELSPSPAERARRLYEAAFLASQTGQFDHAGALLERAHRASDVAPSTYAAATSARLLMDRDGDIDEAFQVLMTALEHASPQDDRDGWIPNTLYLLLITAYVSCDPKMWADFDAALARLEGTPGTEMFSLYRDALSDPARTAHGLRERLLAVVEAPADDVAPWDVTRLGILCEYIDSFDICRDRLRRLVGRERDAGAQDIAMTALSLLSQDAYDSGRWDNAAALANQGLTLIDGGGSPLIIGTLQYRLALLAASRGEIEQAREISDGLLEWSSAHGAKHWECVAWHCRSVAAIAEGDYELAYTCAARVSPAGVLAPYVAAAPWLVFDLVESAMKTGRVAEADAHVAAAQAAELGHVSAKLGLLAAGAAAMAAPPNEAGDLFEAALARPRSDDWPFAKARVRLAYGESLRRDRQPTRAAAALTLANEVFERLGARPWAARASNELRAMGITVGSRVARRHVELTPQELEIARLAAAGMSNKAIGQRLYLSPRTVGSHLYRVFPKLGITRRTELREALIADQDE